MPTAFIFMMGFIPTVIEKLTFLFSFFSLNISGNEKQEIDIFYTFIFIRDD